MERTIRQSPANTVAFLVATVISVAVIFVLIYMLGFRQMLNLSNALPERLRDITFYIWDHHAISEHGLLVYLSFSDFGKKIAYSNHSTLYLLLMYGLYKVESIVSQLPMRAVAAYLQMAFFAGALVWIYLKNRAQMAVNYKMHVLAILALMFFISTPAYWISAGKANVDNVFPLTALLLFWIGYQMATSKVRKKSFWLAIALLVLISPLAACILGLYLFVRDFKFTKSDFNPANPKAFLLSAGLVIYLIPPLTAKAIGMSSSNSSWLFRSGLDGDVTYFTNFVESVLHPVVGRPLHFLILPIILLAAQIIYLNLKRRGDKFQFNANFDTLIFSEVMFSNYMVTLLLWPQAVAIHPYLYDFLVLAPCGALVFINFAHSPILIERFNLWFWVMLFGISFNLTQVAQAARSANLYPMWAH